MFSLSFIMNIQSLSLVIKDLTSMDLPFSGKKSQTNFLTIRAISYQNFSERMWGVVESSNHRFQKVREKQVVRVFTVTQYIISTECVSRARKVTLQTISENMVAILSSTDDG